MTDPTPPPPATTLEYPTDWSLREWRHCVLTTYGSWLYGDPRGFRTRHHREHIEGDYHNPPPPEMYADKFLRSQQLLKQPPVELPANLRPIVGKALVDRLHELNCYVLCAAVSAQHAHLLVKLLPNSARLLLGKAKQHAWFIARENGWNERLWGKRGKALFVRDRRHHANAFHYILDHEDEGAWIWIRPGFEAFHRRGR